MTSLQKSRTHHKYDPPVETALIPDTGGPLTYDEADERLTEYNVPEYDEDSRVRGEPVVGQQGWRWAAQTCAYAEKTIEKWKTESPADRHPWHLKTSVRLECMLRNGCLTEQKYIQSKAILQACFLIQLARPADRREPNRSEVRDICDKAIEYAECKSDAELATELGKRDGSGHKHPPPKAFVVGETSTDSTLLDGRIRTGTWLDQQKLKPLEYIVPRLIPQGSGLIVAPPKKGKSFLVAGVGLAVASGGKVLGCIPVDKRPVLYLALEDGDRRLQKRFRDLSGGEGQIPEWMHTVITAAAHEVLPMVEQFVRRNPDGFVILDTFGKVKPPRRNNQDSYQADYEIGSALKAVIDASSDAASMLTVHHTRKMASDDFVDSVSGTQGLAGAVDFILALKRQRKSNDATLAVTGRDVIEGEYALTAEDGYRWVLDGLDLDGAAAVARERQDEQEDRMTISVNQPGRTFGHSGATRLSSSTTQPGYSYHTHRTPVLSIADITGIPPGQGLYYGPRGWDLITLNPWWRQRQHLGL